MSQPKIEINVVGEAGSGKNAVAWLIADFLEYTGLTVHLNLPDVDASDPEVLRDTEKSIPEVLEIVEQRGTVISVNAIQAPRE